MVTLDVPLQYLSPAYLTTVFSDTVKSAICTYGTRTLGTGDDQITLSFAEQFDGDVNECARMLSIVILGIRESTGRRRAAERTTIDFYVVEEVRLPGNRFRLVRGSVVLGALDQAPTALLDTGFLYPLVAFSNAADVDGGVDATTTTPSDASDSGISTSTLLAMVIPGALVLCILVAAAVVHVQAPKSEGHDRPKGRSGDVLVAADAWQYGGPDTTPYLDIRANPYAHPELHQSHYYPGQQNIRHNGAIVDPFATFGVSGKHEPVYRSAPREALSPYPIGSRRDGARSPAQASTTEGWTEWRTLGSQPQFDHGVAVSLLGHHGNEAPAAWNDREDDFDVAARSLAVNDHGVDGVARWG